VRPRTLPARTAAAVLLAAGLAAATSGAVTGPAGAAGADRAAGPAAAPAAASAWSIQAVPPLDTTSVISRFLDVSCPTASFCLAVGMNIGPDGTQRPMAQTWNGQGWHLTPPPARPAHTLSSWLDLVSCVSPVRCQALGHRGPRADHTVKQGMIAETWNGSGWRMVPVPRTPATELSEISCATAALCFAVGAHFMSTALTQAVSLRWDGARWSPVPPRRPRASTDLEGVSCPGPQNCYAAGTATGKSDNAQDHPLIEHWNGSRWSTQAIASPPRGTRLNDVSCPTATACTAVGSAGGDNSRLLAADLSGGTWTTSTVASPAQAIPHTISFSDVACSAPRVCSAIMFFLNQGEELAWWTASRGATGGFLIPKPIRDLASDIPFGLDCHGSGCTLVGARDATDGKGDDEGTGTAFALRNQGGGAFTAQAVPEPPGTEGGELNHVSCAGAGFCAASTSGAGSFFSVPDKDPSVAVRTSPHGAWRYPANVSHGFLSGLSCTSASFCLALGSAAGAERWDGRHWAPAPSPGHPRPAESGMQALSCTSPSFCLAVGLTAANRSKPTYSVWNGSAWTPIAHAAVPAGSFRSSLMAVSCRSPKFCVAAGSFDPVKKEEIQGLAEIWNGTKWTVARVRQRVTTTNSGIGVSCATRSACMATWGDSFSAFAQWWNGTAWRKAPFAGPSRGEDERSVLDVSCPSATSCTAVGSRHTGARGVVPLIEHWNGQRWSIQSPPVPGLGHAALNGVSCTAPTVCTAVGFNTRLVNIPFATARR
jgi:hypothetical protein